MRCAPTGILSKSEKCMPSVPSFCAKSKSFPIKNFTPDFLQIAKISAASSCLFSRAKSYSLKIKAEFFGKFFAIFFKSTRFLSEKNAQTKPKSGFLSKIFNEEFEIMNEIERNIYSLNQKIQKVCKLYSHDPNAINLIAVSKKQSAEKIIQAINANCKIFGENYVQEAQEKWFTIKKEFPQIKLHFIGKLQSNKVVDVLDLFDCIESLYSEKLAREIQKQSQKLNKNPEIFVQVNIGQEPQKSGIDPLRVKEFIAFAKNDCKLNITGLMSIPPSDEAPSPYFALLNKIARENDLKNLSMGMSADFEEAIALGATHIRVGIAIFGKRE